MKIFIAGGSGAIGSHLIPQLVARGHEVVGTTRSTAKTDALRALGAEAAIVDALDPDSVADAVAKAEPEVVVHQLTALSGEVNMRSFKRMAAATNRLRTEGTDHLLAAARAAGASKVVAQSFAMWVDRSAAPLADETAQMEPNPPADTVESVAALRHVEDAVTGITWANGIALRYGAFYGPGTDVSDDPDATLAKQVRGRKFPIVGDGSGIWSFIHIADAASATVAAIERGDPGIYHVTDDEPAAARDFLPVLASALGAKPPRRVPKWLVRIAAGKGFADLLTNVPAISNEKIKRELDWTLQYPSWRTGFTEGLR